jgi:hypothetical protein
MCIATTHLTLGIVCVCLLTQAHTGACAVAADTPSPVRACAQTAAVRRLRLQLGKGTLTQEQYNHAIDLHIAHAIGIQVRSHFKWCQAHCTQWPEMAAWLYA